MKKEEVPIPSLPPPIGHYSHATKFGDLVFISGMTACDSEGKVIAKGDVAEQARYVFEAIKKTLHSCGADFSDILKITVYLRNIEDRKKIAFVRQEYFGDYRPASTLIEVSKLFQEDFLIEIEAVVGIPDKAA